MLEKGMTTTRAAELSDVAGIAALTAQLGYAADQDAIRGRLARLLGRDDQIVVVAIVDQSIAGWLQAHASDVLESGFRVEIAGLIVAGRFRRRGIGRALVRHADKWAIAIGADAIVVRSNTKRMESHLFYPALGFAPAKTQAVYRKPLRTEFKQRRAISDNLSS